MMISAVVVAIGLVASALPPWPCTGEPTPPTDYDDRGSPLRVEHAEAIEKKGVATLDVVQAQAVRKLTAKLCRFDDPAICGDLTARITIGRVSESATHVCAMAIVNRQQLEAWRTALDPDLDGQLRNAFKELMPDDEPPGTIKIRIGKKRQRAVIVVLDEVNDRGAPGGQRVHWLLGRVRGALTALDVEMREKPARWDGRLPSDVQFALRGGLIDRIAPRTQLPVMEISFSVVDKKRRNRSSAPFSIPAALAPSPPIPLTPPPPLTGLSLHVSTKRDGGSVCPGDPVQVYVTNETEEPLYVRVIDIDSNGEALMLFPNEIVTNDVVMPGKTVPLSADGFTIEGAAHMREQYIAIGARTREALGRFRDTKGSCRFTPTDAAFLKKGQKVEAPFRAVSGFTMLDDVRCNKPMPLPDAALVAQALGDLPYCLPLDR